MKRFPIEAIKVDREFCAGVVEDEGDRHILRAIVSMASAMDVAVVAEGVESPEQARWLRHLGIALVQGYAFGRPAPAATVEALLRDGLPLERLALAFEPLTDEPVVLPAAPRGLIPAEPAAGGATVTLGEAAEALGISTSTVRRWADTGRIQVVRTSGGHRRFPASELRRLAAEAATTSKPEVRPTALPAEPLPGLYELLSGAAGESRPPSRAASTRARRPAGSRPPRAASSSARGRPRSPPRAARASTTVPSRPPAGSSPTRTSPARHCSSATASSSASATPRCGRCRSAERTAPSSSAPAACSAASARSRSKPPTRADPQAGV